MGNGKCRATAANCLPALAVINPVTFIQRPHFTGKSPKHPIIASLIAGGSVRRRLPKLQDSNPSQVEPLMNRILASLIVCASTLVAPLASLAAPITIPTGLNPGDQYRLAFVTTEALQSYSAAPDYNAFVTSTANSVPELAALGTTCASSGVPLSLMLGITLARTQTYPPASPSSDSTTSRSRLIT